MQFGLRSELTSLILKSLALTCLLILPVVMSGSPRIFGDGDVSWHIAAGNWILTHGRIPTTDPFSFTMLGRPWVAFEWLSQVVYASAFDLAGYGGLSIVVMLALLLLHAVSFQFLMNRVQPLALVGALVAMDVIVATFLFARPHVLVWPILAFWTATLLNCRDRGRTPPISLVLVIILWVNMHASFVLGFVIAGAIGLDALIDARWNRALLLGWVKFGLVAVAAAFINANGAVGVVHPFNVMRLDNLAFIQEWKPSSPSMTPAFYGVLILILALSFWQGLKLRPGEILLLSLLLLMAFSQVRHQSWLAIVAPLILTPRLSATKASPFLAESAMRPLSFVLSVAALAMLLARLAWPLPIPERASNPRALLAHVPNSLRSMPVFNGYSFGGPLILAGIRPYIDGRSEMYGDRFVSDFVAIEGGDVQRFNAAVSKYGIVWTILTPNSPLAHQLDALPNWRRIYSDDAGVIHVRVGGAAASPKKTGGA